MVQSVTLPGRQARFGLILVGLDWAGFGYGMTKRNDTKKKQEKTRRKGEKAKGFT